MRAILLLAVVLSGGLAWAGDGSVRIEMEHGDEGPTVVIMCSGERFPLIAERDAAIKTGRDEWRRWTSSPLRDVWNMGKRGRDGKLVLNCTPGGAIVWSTWPEVDFYAMCPPECAKKNRKP